MVADEAGPGSPRKARVNGRYTLVRPLGRGGDADVWLVLDGAREDAPRALKLVRGVADEAARTRLHGEFRRLANLAHPRLVRVHDLEVADGGGLPRGALFFIADFVDGQAPGVALAGQRGAARDAALLTIAEDVGAALAHVHAAELVHHDVKPGNVLVDAAGRATLLDLGLSAARALAGVARGTPAYMAPEALAGVDDPRLDLYGLGATLYEAATGRPPFSAPTLPALVRAILEDPLAPPRVLTPDLPEALAALITRLCARAPEHRPSSALVLLEEVARVRETLGLGGPVVPAKPARGRRPKAAPAAPAAAPAALLPPPLVDRAAPLATLDAALAALAEGRAAPRLVRLAGAPGVGKTRLLDEAVRRHQLRAAAGRAPALTVLGDRWSRLWAALGLAEPGDVAGAPERGHVVRAEQAAAAVARLAADRPVLVHLGDVDDDDRSAALAALAGAEAEPGAWLVVAEHGGVVAGADLELGALDEAGVAAVAAGMLGQGSGATLPPAWVRALARVTGGVPRLVVEAVRAAALARGVAGAPAAPVDELLGDNALDELVSRRALRLTPPARALHEALAVWEAGGAPASLDDLAALAELAPAAATTEAAALAAGGLVRWEGGALGFPSRAHAGAAYRAIPAARRTALHRAARARLEATGGPLVAVARHAARSARGAQVASLLVRAAASARAAGDLRGAFELYGEAVPHADAAEAAEASLCQAELGAHLSRYDEALAAARRALTARDPARRRRAELATIRLLLRRGDLDDAATRLERLAAADPQDEEARGELARLAVTRGQLAAALAAAGAPEDEAPLSGPLPPGRAQRLEAVGLASLYGGDAARADHALARLAAGARAAGDRALEARAAALSGMAAHWRGRLAEAAARYGEALAHARALYDVHAAAVHAQNGAAVAYEQGRHAEALALSAEAIRDLRRLGRPKEVAAALYNRGQALVALGDVDAAARAAAAARAEVRAQGLGQLAVYVDILEGDVARRRGDLDGARTAYARADREAEALGGARERVWAAAPLCEVLAETGRVPEALAALGRARAAAASDEDRDRVVVAAARAALVGAGAPAAALAELGPVARRLRDAGRDDQAWRAAVIAARLAARLGRPAAEIDEAVRAAQAGHAAVLAVTPEAWRAGFAADPDARALAALEVDAFGRSTAPGLIGGGALTPPSPAPAAPAAPAARRLVQLCKRLNSELDVDRLLDDVIDAVIELTEAERGFLLLHEKDGTLAVRVARNLGDGAGAALSRSIAERAARTGEPVITIDAASDERFGDAASVGALRLRSVLAVPLSVRGRVVGAIYVDHRFRRGAFGDAAAEQVLDLADIAAAALHNAQLIAEREAQAREIAVLNQQLAGELAAKEVELEGARARLSAEATELRHAYDALVGRSPRMLALLRLVDRATTTALPVVIHGESGTGKELVARALHDHGPRKGGPFVAINCAAVPETLLEAELFGHVRGAFTGADRDRRGLFEVADGGTLMLDEVGDMTAAMQTKLLRVLSDGEVRRVGADRSRGVDVRVVAASNKDLRRLVADGKFREDLFYRLHVIRIDVPPLRERSEDIPALVTHFLTRLAGGGRGGGAGASASGGGPKKVERAALARLVAYPWPGNVRELENELMRAAALGGDVIGVADLSPAVAAADPTAVPAAPDDLSLRPRVEHLERALLREALARCQGNQTQAAKLLGLSRFGLQKKLRRYELPGSEGRQPGWRR